MDINKIGERHGAQNFDSENPKPESGMITVEHYSYDNKLQRVIEGKDARSIYWIIIENGWVTRLSHASYLGRGLTKANFQSDLDLKMFKTVKKMN